jgi:NAD(P)-dependent dehydrogenase (short-subunit alcohol dehydrogenase family)
MAASGVEQDMSDLENKVAYVTGAASGIGRATARALAREGARLMIVDANATGLEEVRAELADGGADVAKSVIDIADPEAVTRSIEATVARFGRLDLAHNNAAIMGPIVSLTDYPLDAARRLFDVNVFGLFHCLQAQIRVMEPQGKGSIVNTASVSGVHAVPMISIYTATKHAVIGLTKSAAVEYSVKGIRVNCVCPGFIVTDMTSGRFDAETETALAAGHPIGRFGQPEEIAETVVFLLSDKASFTTGSAVFADGGQTV